jgi:proteasome accessory factor PafA2
MANNEQSKRYRLVSTSSATPTGLQPGVVAVKSSMILGTEIEYGITVTNDPAFNPVTASAAVVNGYADGADQVRWSYDDESPGRDARGFTLGEVPIDETDSGLVNAVLHNGARFYVDHAHPEYATPECGDPREATLHDKAGEVVMHRASQSASQFLPEGQRLLLHKNNSDGKGNSYGAHENYLVARSVPFGAITQHMTAFLVSRQILSGSGKVGSEHGRQYVDYQLTQRADFFEEEIGLETTLKRPIINTRDEPHADPGKYRRLHVIFGDANLNEIQTFVKLGSTSLMLMAIEADAFSEALQIDNPVAATTAVSHDLSGTARLALVDGGTTSALGLQWQYLEMLEGYASEASVAPVYKQVLEEWRRLLVDFERGPEHVADRLDWAAKLGIIQAYRDRDGLPWSDAKLRLLDLQFHDIDPDRGLYHKLVKSSRVQRLFSDAEVNEATVSPPPSTRAWFRGECLKRYGSAVVAANWDSLVLDIGESTLVRIPMMEPGRGTRALVEDLFNESPDAATLIHNLGDDND